MENTADKTYRFISDPGHGWIEVPMLEVMRLGLLDRVSRFSYRHGEMAYLEEDCDAAMFMAAKLVRDEVVRMEHVYQNPTPIRGYDRF